MVTPGAYILEGSMRIPPTLSERYFMNITAPNESTPMEAKEFDWSGRRPLTYNKRILKSLNILSKYEENN